MTDGVAPVMVLQSIKTKVFLIDDLGEVGGVKNWPRSNVLRMRFFEIPMIESKLVIVSFIS